MKPIQTIGVEAFLAFLLALVASSVITRRKANSLEGLLAIAGTAALCVLLGGPLLGHGVGSIWLHLPGPLMGALAGVMIVRGLGRGGEYKPGARNELYEALRTIKDTASGQASFPKRRDYDN